MIRKIIFQNFTAFSNLEIPFSDGINILIGENGTGKTHVLKSVYAACEVSKSKRLLADKILQIFLPSGNQLGRLVKRQKASATGSFFVTQELPNLEEPFVTGISFSNHSKSAEQAKMIGNSATWQSHPMESVYIPVKDMMANAPGFRSLYSLRNIHFEEIYADIVDRAFLAPLRGPLEDQRKRLLAILHQSIDGKVITKNEEFFLKNSQGELEFTLLAEGIRKLGLLWILIQNGTLLKGSTLFWDEPETNLNPRLMRTVVEILIQLQRIGVQIFLATHDYLFLKEFDLQIEAQDQIRFHSLYRNSKSHEIELSWTEDYLEIAPNAIDDTFAEVIGREIEKSKRELK